jgi:ectoine hydroxylase-related dioxygenase (phytanoyl-CoA dioxygenase family)
VAARKAFGDLVKEARRRARLTAPRHGRTPTRRRSPIDSIDRRAAWYGPDVSALKALAPVGDDDDALVRRLAVLRERQAELDAILAVRPTVQPRALEAREVEAFFAQGYLVVEQLSSPDELAVIRMIYDKLFDVRAGRVEGLYSDITAEGQPEGPAVFPKIHQLYRFAPELVVSGFMLNARAISRQLLGGEVEFLGGRGMLKPPFCQGETPWHQDAAYHSPDLFYRNVNFWLALQDSPVPSGVMRFVPGSHHGAVVHEHRRLDHGLGLELADTSVLRPSVACPLRAGGATLHHSYLLHHTAANQTSAPRRALIAIFGQPPKERPEPLRFAWQSSAHTGQPGE